MIEFTNKLTTQSRDQMDESASVPNCPCVCHPNISTAELDPLGNVSALNCACVCHPLEPKTAEVKPQTEPAWIEKVEKSANQLIEDILEPRERLLNDEPEKRVEPAPATESLKLTDVPITIPCDAIKNLRIECKCFARRMKQTESEVAPFESIAEESQHEIADEPELAERKCADGCGCSCHHHQEEKEVPDEPVPDLVDDRKPEDELKSVEEISEEPAEEQQETAADETESLPTLGKRIEIPCSDLKYVRLSCQCFARREKEEKETSGEAPEDQSPRCSTACPCHCHPSDHKDSKRGSQSEQNASPAAEDPKFPKIESLKIEDSKPAMAEGKKVTEEAPAKPKSDDKGKDSFLKRLTSSFRQSKWRKKISLDCYLLKAKSW